MGGTKDDMITNSYDLRELLLAPRLSKRHRTIRKADRKLVGFCEVRARSSSFIPFSS